MSRIRHFLFDLGNTLFAIDMQKPLAYWAERKGVAVEDLRQRYRLGEEHRRFERGACSEDEFRASLSDMLQISLSRHEFFWGWNAIYGDAFPFVESGLRQLKRQGAVLGALSNTNIIHEKIFMGAYRHLMEYFDDIFCSHHLGMIKPDPAIFKQVAEQWKVPPQQILYFDDLPQNIKGARMAGMVAVWVQTPEVISDYMEKMSISAPNFNE